MQGSIPCYKDVGFNLVLDGSQLSTLFFVQHHRKSVNRFWRSFSSVGTNIVPANWTWKKRCCWYILILSPCYFESDLIVRSQAAQFTCALLLSIKVFNFFCFLVDQFCNNCNNSCPYPFLFFSGIISSQYVDVQ